MVELRGRRSSGSPGKRGQAQAMSAQSARLLRADGSPIRVLVVDDEPTLAEVLASVLRYEGWEVQTAGDGSAAHPGQPRGPKRRRGAHGQRRRARNSARAAGFSLGTFRPWRQRTLTQSRQYWSRAGDCRGSGHRPSGPGVRRKPSGEDDVSDLAPAPRALTRASTRVMSCSPPPSSRMISSHISCGEPAGRISAPVAR